MEIKLLEANILIELIEGNPFKKRQTDSGLILVSGQDYSQETGQYEALTQRIVFGVVRNVGPDCKYLKVGDGVYVDGMSLRPLPFKQHYWQLNERIVMGYVENTNGQLEKEIERLKEEDRREALKTSLSAYEARPQGFNVV